MKANHDVIRNELSRALLEQAAKDDETAKGLLDTLTGDPEETVRVAQVTMDAALKRARADERAKAETEIEARWQAKYDADKKADELETTLATRSNPPNVQGSPSNGSPVTWESIDKQYTDGEWGRLSAETRKQLTEQADAARMAALRS